VSVILTTVLNLEGNITLNINRILGKKVKGTIKIETTLLFHDDIFFDNIVFLTIAIYLEQKYFFQYCHSHGSEVKCSQSLEILKKKGQLRGFKG
jgi:hypothetical protein